MDPAISIVLISLLFSAFFSGVEIAYVSANKLKVELQLQHNLLSGRLLSYFMKRPSHFLTSTLVGNNIALVVYGIYMAALLEETILNIQLPFLHGPVTLFLLQTIVSTLLVLVVAEFFPKALFRINPNKVLNVLYIPIAMSYAIFWPVMIFIVWISKGFIRLILRTKLKEDSPVFSRLDLFHFIKESSSGEEEGEHEVDTQIFKNALDFANVKVRECMVPRTDIVAIELNEGIVVATELFNESGHSKILVYKETIDNIIGYIHIVDLFKKPEKVEYVLLPILIATEAMPANDLLPKLIEKRRSIAVVVDEFGGTSGIVTMEDIIEEIFGEIEDEHDVEELTEEKISESEYLFSARLEIDYLNENYHLQLPEGDYETLGGFILHIHKNIPEEGEVIELPPYEFTILAVDGARIEEVRLRYRAED
ncbi:MAG: hemolysin family protein [Bacteroidia bacterium]